MRISKEAILAALGGVFDKDSGEDIVSLGMVSDVHVTDAGEVVFSIVVDPAKGAVLEPLRQEAEAAVFVLDGVHKAMAVLTAENKPEEQKRAPTHDPHNFEKNPKLELPVRHIIAVASGKGGVGKSTVAANVAISMAKNGQKVGLLDADIYGPSQPRMMGISGQKPEQIDGTIQPLSALGVKVMSIGFMVEEEKALVWRGPMVQTAIYQLLRDVNWGSEADPLDVLVVDMPPGTGDAQLTMAQKVPLSGAIIVSTPQDIALLDARKGVEMFETTNVPILGLIENMSTHVCSECGHEEHVFGHGGARAEAEKLGVPFLGEIPLHIDICQNSDVGKPSSKYFEDIAVEIIKRLEEL